MGWWRWVEKMAKFRRRAGVGSVEGMAQFGRRRVGGGRW